VLAAIASQQRRCFICGTPAGGRLLRALCVARQPRLTGVSLRSCRAAARGNICAGVAAALLRRWAQHGMAAGGGCALLRSG